ncbi:hypothetical protein JCM3766R1_005089 [Sporobolomyces carnicolor]
MDDDDGDPPSPPSRRHRRPPCPPPPRKRRRIDPSCRPPAPKRLKSSRRYDVTTPVRPRQDSNDRDDSDEDEDKDRDPSSSSSSSSSTDSVKRFRRNVLPISTALDELEQLRDRTVKRKRKRRIPTFAGSNELEMMTSEETRRLLDKAPYLRTVSSTDALRLDFVASPTRSGLFEPNRYRRQNTRSRRQLVIKDDDDDVACAERTRTTRSSRPFLATISQTDFANLDDDKRSKRQRRHFERERLEPVTRFRERTRSIRKLATGGVKTGWKTLKTPSPGLVRNPRTRRMGLLEAASAKPVTMRFVPVRNPCPIRPFAATPRKDSHAFEPAAAAAHDYDYEDDNNDDEDNDDGNKVAPLARVTRSTLIKGFRDKEDRDPRRRPQKDSEQPGHHVRIDETTTIKTKQAEFRFIVGPKAKKAMRIAVRGTLKSDDNDDESESRAREPRLRFDNNDDKVEGVTRSQRSAAHGIEPNSDGRRRRLGGRLLAGVAAAVPKRRQLSTAILRRNRQIRTFKGTDSSSESRDSPRRPPDKTGVAPPPRRPVVRLEDDEGGVQTGLEVPFVRIDDELRGCTTFETGGEVVVANDETLRSIMMMMSHHSNDDDDDDDNDSESEHDHDVNPSLVPFGGPPLTHDRRSCTTLESHPLPPDAHQRSPRRLSLLDHDDDDDGNSPEPVAVVDPVEPAGLGVHRHCRGSPTATGQFEHGEYANTTDGEDDQDEDDPKRFRIDAMRDPSSRAPLSGTTTAVDGVRRSENDVDDEEEEEEENESEEAAANERRRDWWTEGPRTVSLARWSSDTHQSRRRHYDDDEEEEGSFDLAALRRRRTSSSVVKVVKKNSKKNSSSSSSSSSLTRSGHCRIGLLGSDHQVAIAERQRDEEEEDKYDQTEVWNSSGVVDGGVVKLLEETRPVAQGLLQDVDDDDDEEDVQEIPLSILLALEAMHVD